MTVRVDLHSHTHRSHDCVTSYRALIAACQRRRIDVLAITDHNRVEGALELSEMPGFRCIVGEEISTTEGEIIGLFLKSFIPPRLSPEETIAEIRSQGGVVYMPHPFDTLRRSVIKPHALMRVAASLDVVEVLNARCHTARENGAALQFAQERGLLMGAGSDAHTAGEIGQAGIEMPDFTDAESFKHGLRSAVVFGSPSSRLVHVASTFNKVRKRVLSSWRSI